MQWFKCGWAIDNNTGDAPKAHLSRGAIYAMRKLYDVALAEFNMAIELQPDYALAYFNRGVIYYYQGRTALANADFRKVIELAPGFPEAAKAREVLDTLGAS